MPLTTTATKTPGKPAAPGGHWDALFEGMERYVRVYFRQALALIFIWFGALKVVGASPVADLLGKLFPFVPSDWAVVLLGWWEIVIGAAFVFRRTVRLALALILLQLPGTFLPFFLTPELCFRGNVFYLTLEGEFIVKNLLIIGAVLLIGGTLHPTRRPVASPEILK